MEQAVKYTEHMDTFCKALKTSATTKVETKVGRRFDRVTVDGAVKYFVDRHTWEIYGAKSSFQFNPRRLYGKLDTVTQYDWTTNLPKVGTDAEKVFAAREATIQKNYKARGRPKKATK